MCYILCYIFILCYISIRLCWVLRCLLMGAGLLMGALSVCVCPQAHVCVSVCLCVCARVCVHGHHRYLAPSSSYGVGMGPRSRQPGLDVVLVELGRASQLLGTKHI